jgi:hypothetical protein
MNRDQRSRRCRPRLEGLERREVPTAVHPGGTAAVSLLRAGAASRNTPPWVSQTVLDQVSASLYAPITTTSSTTVGGINYPPGTYSVPQPTPAEIGRQTFWMQFVGHYYVGAPRFSNQSSTIHIYSNGRDVTSNQSLNARGEVLLLPPANPSASPTTNDPMAGQVAGLLSMFPANALQSGSSFFADVTNLPGIASNNPGMLDHGLPSHLQFVLDPGGVTGGVYSVPYYTVATPAGESSLITGGSGGAVSTQGAGVMDIRYIPTNHLRAGARESGTVIVRVQGLLNLTGVTNPLYNGIN